MRVRSKNRETTNNTKIYVFCDETNCRDSLVWRYVYRRTRPHGFDATRVVFQTVKLRHDKPAHRGMSRIVWLSDTRPERRSVDDVTKPST